MINEKLLNEILNKYGIAKTDKLTFFDLAMTHSSYANEHKLTSNERIEFLGDAILGFLVAEYIYRTFKNIAEGKMSKLRATYVCEEANANYAHNMGIDKLLLLGNGEEHSGGRNRPAILSDAFECFLGAVYFTMGLDEVRKILSVEVFPHILATDDQQFIDYKSRLQEYVQAETRSALEYKEEEVVGPPHMREFTISVYLDDIKLGTGKGKTKKAAEQAAAEAAIDKMAIN